MSCRVPSGVGLCTVLFVLPLLSAQNAGLPQQWEFRNELDSLVNSTQKLKPLLDAVKPGDWTTQGAPDTYQAQWKSLVAEIEYVSRSAADLGAEPERLTLALDTYFRLQSLDVMLVSLIEGVRKYQNPALADLISGAGTDASVQREKLREYIVRLAAAKEQELKVMDQEAQRCRALLATQPPARKNSEKKVEAK